MNKIIVTFLLATVSLSMWAVPVWAGTLLELDADQRKAFGITTAAVQRVSESLSKPYPAKVQVPNAQLRVVSAPLEGVVEALLVAEGESVNKGQTLAQVRSPGLLELQTGFLETLTRRRLSSKALKRDSQLFKEGIVAKRRLLETRSRHTELVTAEQRDRQALMLAGMSAEAIKVLQRSQKLTPTLSIVAPLSGVVLEQIATAGQRLAISEPLYRIGHLSPLWIEVHVPLDALSGVKEGSAVRITEGSLSARVITVGRMVHGADQGVLVRAEIREGTELLRPGQFVEARLSQTAADDAVRVPTRAMVRISGKDHVFVSRDGGFERLMVDVISRESDYVLVHATLQTGDAVVVGGTVALKAAFAAGVE